MKKYFLYTVFACMLFSLLPVSAKKNAPDPFYLSTPVLDAEQIEIKEKEKDVRTLNEKVREKLHLPKTKKIYIHNIDRSTQPVTLDDYYTAAVEQKRKDFQIPEPTFTAEDGFYFSNPHFRVISFNTPPGQRNIDLTQLVKRRTVASAGILSPDKSRIVYTKSFFYPQLGQTSSAAYYVPIEDAKDAYDVLYQTNVMQGDVNPILSVGMDAIQDSQFKTLFPIDWSEDGTKIAFKEKIGSNYHDTWKTNVIIYDFESKNWKRLTAVREAIIYWWRQNKQIELKDYMWDIFPIGWEKQNPDRLVVYAYAFTDNVPFFLGTWSIDYNEAKSELISIDSTSVEINLNGYGLKEVKLEN